MSGRLMRMRSIRKIILPVLLAVGFLVRLRAVPPAIADVDGVNFARALGAFDPLHQSPHLPGYPVYVLATKLFATLGLNEVWALALPALLLFPLGAALLYLGVRRRFGEAHAVGALLFATFAPSAVLAGAWPTSDGFGFALLLAALGLSFLDRPLASGLLFGLLLGARLSWWPLVPAALLLTEQRSRFAVGAGAATAAWVAGLCWFAPPAALLEGALAFGQGHFTEWGRTALDAEASLAGRALLGAATFIAAAGLAGLAGVAGLPLLPKRLLLFLLPYALWILFAQNLEKTRHFLPLLPLLGIGAAALLLRLPKHQLFAAATTALLLVAALPAAFHQGTRLAPAAAIARELRARSPERLQVFAGESARVFEHLAPEIRVWRPASPEILEREARAAHRRGAEVLIVSDAPGASPSADLVVRRYRPEEIHARR